jgi:hypothetical protein
MAEREPAIIIGVIILVLGLHIEYTHFHADTICSRLKIPWLCAVTPDSPPAIDGALVAMLGIVLIVTSDLYYARLRNRGMQLD